MRALAVLVLAALVVATSCRTDPESAPSASRSAPASLSFTVADQPDVVRLAMVQPPSFRPDEVQLSDQAGVVVADLLYDGLTQVDGHTGALRPGLARSWEADPTYRRWTFTLDPLAGVEAEEVARSLSAMVVERDGLADRRSSPAALTAGIASVTAVGRRSVAIELERPNAGLPWILSGLPYSVVGVDGVATGDYEIQDGDDRSLRLRRRSVRGGALAPVPAIEVVWTEGPTEAGEQLVDGVVDGAVVGEEVLAEVGSRFGAAVVASPAVRFYVLNPSSVELADRDQRAALVALADAGALVDDVGRADLVPVDGLVSPSTAGYRPDGCGEGCGELDDGTDGVGASAVAWPMSVPLRVTFAGAGQASTAEALAAQLADAGLPAAAVEASARELAAAIVGGSPDLFAFGWVAPAGSVDAVLPPLLRSDSPANVARFASPGLPELLDEASVTGDDEARWEILDEAHRLAMTEAKVLPIAASTGTMVLAPGLAEAAMRADGSLDFEWCDERRSGAASC